MRPNAFLQGIWIIILRSAVTLELEHQLWKEAIIKVKTNG